MIPQSKQATLAHELSELDATPEQVETIGTTLFHVSALPVGHDVDYLMDRVQENEDSVVQEGYSMILKAML